MVIHIIYRFSSSKPIIYYDSKLNGTSLRSASWKRFSRRIAYANRKCETLITLSLRTGNIIGTVSNVKNVMFNFQAICPTRKRCKLRSW